MRFFCIIMTKIDQLIIGTFKVEWSTYYPIKDTETASAKFQKELFSWATKPEDCSSVLILPVNVGFRS